VERGADGFFRSAQMDTFATRGMWPQALSMLAAPGIKGPLPIQSLHHFALTLLKMGHREEYRRFCALVRQQMGEEQPAPIGNLIAWICTLGPNALDDYSGTIASLDATLREVKAPEKRALLHTLGALLFRAGRYKEAVARLRESVAETKGEGSVQDWVYL